MNKNDIRNIIDENVKRLSKYLNRNDLIEFSKGIEIDIRNIGTKGGQAIKTGHSYKLEINSQVIEKYHKNDVTNTVVHELCHLVAMYVYGVTKGGGHGKIWKKLMVLLDRNPERCHSFNLDPKRKCKRFIYTCGCKEYEITSIRHNRVLKGKKYFCCKCKNEIKYVRDCWYYI